MEGLRVYSNTVSFEISILKFEFECACDVIMGSNLPRNAQMHKVTRVIIADLVSLIEKCLDPSDLVFGFQI